MSDHQIDFAPFSEEVSSMLSSLESINGVFEGQIKQLQTEQDEVSAQLDVLQKDHDNLGLRIKEIGAKSELLRKAIRALGETNGREHYDPR